VLSALETAYAVWRAGGPAWNKRKVKSREFAAAYDWERVWQENWMPLLAEMERRLKAGGLPRMETTWTGDGENQCSSASAVMPK